MVQLHYNPLVSYTKLPSSLFPAKSTWNSWSEIKQNQLTTQPYFFPEDKHIGMDRELNNRDIGEG